MSMHRGDGSMTVREMLTRAAVGQRRPLVIASALFAGHQAGEALVPVLVGVVIDRAVDGGTVGALVLWLSVLVVDFLVLSVCWRFGIRFSLRGALLAEHGARVAVTARVLDPRGGAESTRLPGALAALANGDTRRLGLLNHALPNIAAAVAAVLVGGGALLLISVPLGLLVLLGAPLLLVLITVLGRPLERRNAAQLAEVAGSAGLATDMVTGVRVLKGLGAESAAIDRYATVSRRSLGAAVSAGRAMGAYRASALVLNGLFLAVVAYAGARLALDGQLSPGELVSAVGLAQFLLEPLSMFGSMSVLVAQARASAGRIAEVHSTPYAIDAGGPEPVDGPGRLELRGVVHGPLDGLDLQVRAGEHVAVVAQAADATALLDLLARRADPTAGVVALDGVPLPAAELDALRRAVLVADHDGELFEGSVRDNVGLRAVDPALVPAAMAAAGADQVVEVLADGADAEVGERGRALSGGQRQRVALARALAADPMVLVLHDPTTAVDSVTEAGVAAGIHRVRHGRSTLVVTTSPALLATADRVLVLRDGAVVATGTHDELLRTDSDYRGQVLS